MEKAAQTAGQTCDQILEAFERRFRQKKRINICVSSFIAILGITSFLYGIRLESISTIFRWMTVDGTVFTTLGAIAFIAINIVEVRKSTEMTRITVYYIRLSSAVAESVILIVVLFSQLPFFLEHLPMFDRYDSFVMHILVPLLGISSFLANDSPIGKLSAMERWHGTWFVSFYAIIVLPLIAAEVIPTHMIPYFFLDFRHYAWATAVAFVFIYGCAYLMGWYLSEKNRKLSWLWFKGIAQSGHEKEEV